MGRLSVRKVQAQTLRIGNGQAKKDCTVRFRTVVNDELFTVQTVEVARNSTISQTPSVSRPGYTFAGWYDQSVGGNPLTANTQINEDTTYYAHWTEGEAPISGGGEAALPRITFHFYIGYPVGQCDIRSVTVQQVRSSMSEEQANKYIPSCPGNEFLGWFYHPTAMGMVDGNGNTVGSSWNWPGQAGFPLLGEYGGVVAHWALETAPDEPIDNPESDFHTVYLEDGNHNGTFITSGPFQMNVRHGTVITREKLDEMFTPTLANGTFVGWYDKESGGNEIVSSIRVNDDIHLYAHWDNIPQPAEYRMCRLQISEGNPAGGFPALIHPTNGVRYGTVLSEEDVNNICQPRNFPGNEFVGWYGKVGDSDEMPLPLRITDDTLVSAHWKTLEFPIIYDMKGHGEPNPNNRQKYTFAVLKSGFYAGNEVFADDYEPDPPADIDDWIFTGWTQLHGIGSIDGWTYISDVGYIANWEPDSVVVPELETTRIVYSQESGLPEVFSDKQIFEAPEDFPNAKEITEIHFGTCVNDISYGAFSETKKLEVISIPKTLTFRYNPFQYLSSIKQFIVDSRNPSYRSRYGLLLTKDGKTLIHGVNRNVRIPSFVETIGDYAFFSMNNLTEITIPDNLKIIGMSAFDRSALKRITFGNGMQEIKQSAFSNCKSLEKVTIPAAHWERNVFSGCSALETAELLPGFTNIPYGMFNACRNLKQVIIPDGILNVEQYALYNCSGIQSITLPDSVNNIEAYAFYNCSSLKDITFLGAPPTVFQGYQYLQPIHSFKGVAEGAVAHVDPDMGDWPENGTEWNGLIIRHEINPIKNPEIIQQFESIAQMYPVSPIREDAQQEEEDEEASYVPYDYSSQDVAGEEEEDEPLIEELGEKWDISTIGNREGYNED